MRSRWLVVALALAAASMFALSVQSRAWWTIATVELGPFGSRSPFGGVGDLAWAGGSARWERFGASTRAAGLIAMAVLVFVAGAVAARRVPRLAAKMALVAIGTALVVGGGFLATRPTSPMPFELGLGAPMLVGAAVLGAVAAVLAGRARPTAAPGE